MIDPANPADVRREVEAICRSVANRHHCDPHEVVENVVAVLVATAHKNAVIAEPQKYLRHSARRAAYRICQQNRNKWRQATSLSGDSIEPIDKQKSPLERLIDREESEIVESAILRLEPNERRAINRFRRRISSAMRKGDYYLKDRAIQKIKSIVAGSRMQ